MSTPLDEKGFIFLDNSNRPFLCAMWGERPWLFYWHTDKHWVSLRPVTQTDIFVFPHNLTEDEQKPYRLMQEAWERGEKVSEQEQMLMFMGRTPTPRGTHDHTRTTRRVAGAFRKSNAQAVDAVFQARNNRNRVANKR